MRNRAVARNWPQVTLRHCRFPCNWISLLGKWSLWETPCGTVLLIEIGAFCYKAKTSPKHRAELSCCSKLASKHSAQLSFCFKLARKVMKPKPVKNAVQNFRSQRFCCLKLAPNHTTPLSFCFKLAHIVTKVKVEEETVRMFPVARNWRHNSLRSCRFA